MAALLEELYTASNGSNVASGTVTATVSGATSGNSLFAVITLRAGSTLTSIDTPTGYTAVETGLSTQRACGLYKRLASGTSADDCTAVYTGATSRVSIAVYEFSGLDSTDPVEDSAQDQSLGSVVTTIGTGTATPVSANGTAFAALGLTNWTGWDSSSDLNNITDDLGLTYHSPEHGIGASGGSNRPGSLGGHLNYTSATGKSNNWTRFATGNSRAMGSILVAKEPAVGGNLFVQLARYGGLAGPGGLAGKHGGLAA